MISKTQLPACATHNTHGYFEYKKTFDMADVISFEEVVIPENDDDGIERVVVDTCHESFMILLSHKEFNILHSAYSQRKEHDNAKAITEVDIPVKP